MLVTMYPGANREDVRDTLRQIESAAQNVRGVSGFHVSAAYNHLTSYLEWATNAVRMLEHRISAADIDRLVLTPGYERLLSAAASLTSVDTGTQRVLNGLVDHEINQQRQELQEAVKDLDDYIRRWPANADYFVADTSVYIQHDDKLENLDFADLLGGWRDHTVIVIVPSIVLDELEGLKDRGPDKWRKWRARYTLAILARVFSESKRPGVIREPAADGTRGAVLMQLLFDPPRHERLPNNDDEIIDRALGAQGLTGTSITFLTFDTNQAEKARRVGLKVRKLLEPVGEEPDDPRHKERKMPEATANSTGA
jgi:hypothetical protein